MANIVSPDEKFRLYWYPNEIRRHKIKCSACKQIVPSQTLFCDITLYPFSKTSYSTDKGWKYFKCCSTCLHLLHLAIPDIISNTKMGNQYGDRDITIDNANTIIMFFGRSNNEKYIVKEGYIEDEAISDGD